MEANKPMLGIEWWKVLLLILVIMILPQLFVFYLRSDTREDFHRFVDENKAECLERSEKDQFPRQICIESARQAREVFSATAGDAYPGLTILLSINFSIAFSVLMLAGRVSRLSKGNDA